MKHRFILIPLLLALTWSAHAGGSSKGNRVELFEIDTNTTLVSIEHREWGGLFGPHGFVGFENVHYWAALKGAGPEFANPEFDDNPPDIHCVGTITLNRKDNVVVISMRRIVSGTKKPEKTKQHPANGTYKIASIIKGKPDWMKQTSRQIILSIL